MRCEDVIRELATPSRPEPAGLADHLAECPECARWAERNSALDRLWDATRPAVPSADAWDSVWAGVADALERSPEPAVLPMTDTPAPVRRRAALIFAWVQTAAAAAVLGFVLIHSHTGKIPPQIAQNPAPATPVKVVTYTVEVEQGELPVIRVSARGDVQTVDLALNESAARVDSAFEALNDWEGNAVQ